MTPEKQQIAIAEACGWKQGPSPYFKDVQLWISPHGAHAGRVDDPTAGPGRYLKDLNTMHEAEKGLNEADRHRYRFFLCEILEVKTGEDGWRVIHSAAAQRAEAFLRAIGKWEE